MYDGGGVPELAICLADLVVQHLGTLRGDGGTALFLQWTLVGTAVPRFPQALWKGRLPFGHG